MKKEDVLKNLVCRRCSLSALLTIIEEDYDWEVSCGACGELWWIPKKQRNLNIIGDELKYQSSPYVKKRGKKK